MGGAVTLHSDSSTLTLQSCVFSNNIANAARFGAVSNFSKGGTLNVYGSTFYGNKGGQQNTQLGLYTNFGGTKPTVNLVGNIFYSEASTASVFVDTAVANRGVLTSKLNVYDKKAPVGTANGFAVTAEDSVLTALTFNATSFYPTSAVLPKVTVASNNGYPTVDFYGQTSPSEALVGAVQLAPDLDTLTVKIAADPSLLAGIFNKDVIEYTVNVGGAVTNVTIAAKSDETGATVTVGDQTGTGNASKGVTLGALGSSTPVIVTVAYGGSTKTYTVTIVRKHAQTINWSQPLNGYVNGTIALTAESSVDPSLPISYASDNEDVANFVDGVLHLYAEGNANITASQAGNDTTYAAAPNVTKQVTVSLNPRSITWTNQSAIATLTYGDAPIDLVASVADGATVEFTSDDQAVVEIVGTTLTIVAAGGPVTITASVGEDAVYEGATLAQNVTVAKAPNVIAWTQALSGTIGDTITLGATADGGDVSYVSGAPDTAKVIDVAGVAKLALLKAGPVTITASSASDANYLAATDSVKTFTVAKKAQTVTWTQVLADTVKKTITLTGATTDGDGAITYSSTDAKVTVSGTTLTLVTAGTATVTATAAATDTYAAATKDLTVTIYDTAPAPPAKSTNANLATLSVTGQTLTPAFGKDVTAYTLDVANEVATITIVATVEDAGKATVAGAGEKTLTVGANAYDVVVTAENGTTKKTYKVTVTRAEAKKEPPTAVSTQTASLVVYPNPTSGVVYVDNAGAEVVVYSLSGSVVVRTNESVVDLSGVASGVYIIKVGGSFNKIVKR
jgi:hypothetical protein